MPIAIKNIKKSKICLNYVLCFTKKKNEISPNVALEKFMGFWSFFKNISILSSSRSRYFEVLTNKQKSEVKPLDPVKRF